MINKSKIFALILVVVLSLSFTVTAYAAAPASASATVTGSKTDNDDDELIECNEKVIWEKVEDAWRGLDINGEPVLGWAKRGEYIYFLGKDGFPKTGWVKSFGKWFYLYDEKDIEILDIPEILVGTLATDIWINNYQVDKTGALIKTKK